MMEYKIADHIAAMKPSAIREIFKVLVDPEVIALSAGSPDSSAYPVKEMAEVGDEIFANEFVTTLGYGTTEGYTPLRERTKSACERSIRQVQMTMMLSSPLADSRQSACLHRP